MLCVRAGFDFTYTHHAWVRLQALLRAGSASSGGTAAGVGPGLACRDAVAGEACWDKVQWAMKTGILEHPDWRSAGGR